MSLENLKKMTAFSATFESDLPPYATCHSALVPIFQTLKSLRGLVLSI